MSDMLATIRKAVAPIQRRVMLAVGRAVIQAVRDDAGIQTVKVSLLAGELRDRVERMQEYGFTSVPHPGCEAAAVFVGGDRGHGIIVATDDRRYRLVGLEQGEVALYTDEGDLVHIKRGGTIHVRAATKVEVETPLAEFSGDIIAEGEITDRNSSGGRSMSSMRDIYDTHTHPENDSGGPTDAPNQQMG